MLRASSLYIVIIISTVIAIITASLITVAFFYRLEHQKSLRFSKLSRNLQSSVDILLSRDQLLEEGGKKSAVDLFGDGIDSVLLSRHRWGVFDIATAEAFELRDTLKKAFYVGISTTRDQSVLYLSDEDRPLSVSGNTRLIGDAILPKAGIKQAYVEGKPFSGGRLVNGDIKVSSRTLPTLDTELIDLISKVVAVRGQRQYQALPRGSVNNSFFDPVKMYDLKSVRELRDVVLNGKIIVVSDTIVRINRSASLKDVIIYAPAILVEEGFRGNCQLFARDSIVTGSNVVFDYPSCLGVLKDQNSKMQSKIELGSNVRFSGILFTYEKIRSDLQTQISIGKDSRITGEVYACGFVKLDKPVVIAGLVMCNRLVIKTSTTLYENFLVDVTIDRPGRSTYYLSSPLFIRDRPEKKVLKWLD